jgi:predicted ATP-grasp superfamily ATP-dependent carboligase
MSAKKPTVILGADVSALNVARSLGRRGIPVFVIGGNRKDYAAASKYTTFVMCEDLNDENSVLKVLQDIAKTVSRKMVLMATADLHVLHMSRNRDDLAKDYCFVLPAEGTIETLMDKKKFARYAVSHDFKVPETYYSSSSKQLERISRKVSYPCVVKPLYRTEYWSRCVPPEKKVMKAATATELTDVVQSLGASDESLVVQEWIPGGDEDVHFCLAYLDRSEKPLAPPVAGDCALSSSNGVLRTVHSQSQSRRWEGWICRKVSARAQGSTYHSSPISTPSARNRNCQTDMQMALSGSTSLSS